MRGLWLRRWSWSRHRWPLLVPLVELLRLLLLLLRRPLLHRRSRPDQRMVLLGLVELAVLRLCRTIRLFAPTFFRGATIFLRSSSLLFVDPRLRLEHWLHHGIVILVRLVGLPERTESLLVRLWPLLLIDRSRPRRTERPD